MRGQKMQPAGGLADAARPDEAGGRARGQATQQHLVDTGDSYRNLRIAQDVGLARGGKHRFHAREKFHALIA